MSTDDLIAQLRAQVAELEEEVGKLRGSNEEPGENREGNDQEMALLHALMDNAPVGFLFFGTDSRFRIVNRRLAELNGLPPEWGVGCTLEEVVPDLAPRAHQVLRHVIDTGKPVLDLEFSCEADNAPGPARSWSGSWYPITGKDGRLLGVGCMLTEITSHKRAEEALRQSELLNKQVIENLPECIFGLDVTSDGRFKFAGLNPAEEKAIGYSNAQVSGRFIEEVLDENVANTVIAHYRRCLEVGTRIEYEDELSLPTGLRYFHTNLIPVRNADGIIHRIIGCCSDLTDARRMQEEALARQKLESMGLLASGIAHDFNNLLGGILASSELALSEPAVGSGIEEELQRIRTASIRGSEIVRQLMIYGAKEDTVFEPVNVSFVIQDILQLIKVSISKQVTLQLDLGRDLPPAYANPPQLRQIVMNLVSNASEAIGDQQGLIRIGLERVRLTRDSEPTDPTNLPKGDYVKLEISDTGGGMSPEVQARIFDPFYSTKQAGRGLGLAVVHGILRTHGGAISVVSAPGQGTTIRVFLPYAGKRAKAQRGARSLGPAQVLNRTGTILIVDDEDLLRTTVSKLLKKSGFTVIEAGDGSAAMDLLHSHNDAADLVLLDVSLPGKPSRDVFEEVQRMSPAPKIIITSAYGKEIVDASFSGLRVDHFIRKPFQIAELLRLLRRTLAE
jgi:two-component system, cell cycle sensor histidine kinase and response regulator CckA